MKMIFKRIKFLLVVLLALFLTGCGEKEVAEISFEAQYIKTDSVAEDLKYPMIRVIKTKEELKTYYQENSNNYNFINNDGSSVSFLTAIDGYDEEYFEDSFLVLILLEENSDSIRHNISKVSEDGEILIERVVSDNEESGITNWHVLVELNKKYQDINFETSFKKVSE